MNEEVEKGRLDGWLKSKPLKHCGWFARYWEGVGCGLAKRKDFKNSIVIKGKKKGGAAGMMTTGMSTACSNSGDYSIRCGRLDELNGKNVMANRNEGGKMGP